MNLVDEHGSLVRAYPLKPQFLNGPFIALLVVLTAVLGGVPAWLGDLKAALGCGLVPLVALAFFTAFSLGSEVFGPPKLAAVHERGVRWRQRLSGGFVPWGALARVERRRVTGHRISVEVLLLHRQGAGLEPIVLPDAGAAELIERHLPRPPA